MTDRYTLTLKQAFALFEKQGGDFNPTTLMVYGRALQYFFTFLQESDMAAQLSITGPDADQRPLNMLGESSFDINILNWFVAYLSMEATTSHGCKNAEQPRRSLEPGTVRIYGQALITWFQFLAEEMLLPPGFPISVALRRARNRLKSIVPAHKARGGAPEPPEGMEALIHAFDDLQIAPQSNVKEQQRQRLEGLRNRALLYALADAGGRVSEILQISADDVLGAFVNRSGVWRINVRGKGRGKYGKQVTLRFTQATLNAMNAYLETRADPGATALFVSHARTRPDYHGRPLSRYGAWRVIDQTARRLGLAHIHPHDFRHWRATDLLLKGVPLD
ncbi:MAG: tyrosine-type recombinase/integrase [Phycisphaerae bacterium]|nr:tyrosine-type recombinase/integrase [Phycisphaerae bacterium]